LNSYVSMLLLPGMLHCIHSRTTRLSDRQYLKKGHGKTVRFATIAAAVILSPGSIRMEHGIDACSKFTVNEMRTSSLTVL
jgi:hypothetical protein